MDGDLPYKKVNRAWRKITLAVVITAASYKLYRNYTRLDTEDTKLPPGSFTGSTGVQPAVRRSKYEGAGNAALGRGSGDRFN
ncbi:hypothetical protein DASB73_008120 [Starmerella bacillaris]|uniref:Uncharacterized protein n=1 Tax=Starmerella bacillaris TaxID=1247836 RepID=A0AAV5RE66_STABA|nr:hypothetical protein DASB73_008120 [Starmerella bacillaris]